MFKTFRQLAHRKDSSFPLLPSSKELMQLQHIIQSQQPLVSMKSVNKFRTLLAKASVGEHFLLQLGDCSQSFYECDSDTMYEKLDLIWRLTDFFKRKTGAGVIRIGALAGEFSKPVLHPDATLQNGSSYFNIPNNLLKVAETDKMPDFWRMLLSHNCLASIHAEVKEWNNQIDPLDKIYTSHELQSLPYEETLTKEANRPGLYYNLSSHLLCLDKGMLDSLESVNYLQQIANPIGLKIGADTCIRKLVEIITILDPNCQPGRITLLPQLGIEHVDDILPQLIEAVNKTQRKVLWSCDPMRGNTETLDSGRKIRRLSAIIEEIKSSFLIHAKMGSKLNGLSLDITHKDVVECLNYGPMDAGLLESSSNKYELRPTIRLNYEQAMHVLQHAGKLSAV